MDSSITQDQLKNYREEDAAILAINGRNEVTDPFGKQWNETFLDFIHECDSRGAFKVGIEYLNADFHVYENSPLNRYCRFDDFFEILEISNAESIRQLTNRVSEEHDYYTGRPDEEFINMKEMISTIIEVSRSANEIDLLIRKLFKKLKEFHFLGGEERRKYPRFKDYVSNSQPLEEFDIIEVLTRKKGLMDLLDEEWAKFCEHMATEFLEEELVTLPPC